MDNYATLRWGLLQMQEFAEERMVESCVIERVTGSEIDDEGREVNTYATIYDGPVRIRSYRPYPEDREVTAGTSTSQMYDLHIPAVERIPALLAAGVVSVWDGPIRNGDRMTRSTVGRAPEVYGIETEHDVTDQTAQRLVGRLITGGVFA